MPENHRLIEVQTIEPTRHGSLIEDELGAAGIHLVRVGAEGFDAPKTALSSKLGIGPDSSARNIFRQLGTKNRKHLLSAMIVARKTASATCKLEMSDDTVKKPGDIQWLRVHVRFDQSDAHARWTFVAVDISGEQLALENLKAEEEHLRHIVEYNPQLPWIADANGQIIDFTDRWLNSTGMSRNEAVGEGWLKKTHPDDIERVGGTISRCHKSGEPFDETIRLEVNGTYRWMRARGYPRRDENGNVVCWYGYTEDVHEKVLIDQQILWDAEHDSLTGLHNRAYFSTKLEKAIKAAPANLKKVALLLVDLDNFKQVNDLMGHVAGDDLIRKFAEALRAAAPADAAVARLGGDEFAILLNGLNEVSEAVEVAEAILRLQGNFDFGGRSVTYHASVGIGMFPEHGIDANQLLRHTDLALYKAKSNGRAQIQVFAKEMLDDMQERVAMVNRARTAAREGRILAYYQPKVCLRTRKLAGFEALLRWQDNLGKIHAPASIYAAFDEKTVAELLGKTMISHIFDDISSWKSQGLEFHQVAINASPVEMRQSDFVTRLTDEMKACDIAISEIEIEITEGVFIGTNADTSRKSIDQLHKAGIPLALDDFGTGYASLSHLRNLPVSTLKIDRSFVQDLADNTSDFAIVSAIIAMGKASGMKVVAEGIENKTQEDLLTDLGCDIGQGFLLGKPIPAHDVAWLIEHWEEYLERNVQPPKWAIDVPMRRANDAN